MCVFLVQELSKTMTRDIARIVDGWMHAYIRHKHAYIQREREVDVGRQIGLYLSAHTYIHTHTYTYTHKTHTYTHTYTHTQRYTLATSDA